MGLIEAHETLQKRLEEQIRFCQRIGRWARPYGLEVDSTPRFGDINTWRPAWAGQATEGSKSIPASRRALPHRIQESGSPAAVCYGYSQQILAQYKLKEPQRIAFAHALRNGLGKAAGVGEPTMLTTLVHRLGSIW